MAYVVLIGPHFTVNILSLLRRFIEIIFIMIRVQVEVPSLETSKFSLYFSSLGNGRVSRVEGHRSRVEGHRSRVEGHRSRVIGRGSKVEVEGQKSRSRFKSRGRGSKVEGRNSRVENGKYYFFINTFLEHYIFGICCQNFKGSPDN